MDRIFLPLVPPSLAGWENRAENSTLQSVGEQRRAVISTDFQPFRYRFLLFPSGREREKRREERTHTHGKGREEGRVIPKIWNNGIKEDIGDRKFDQPVLGSGSNPLNFSHSSSNTAFPRTGKRFYPTILAIRWVKSETASGRTRPAKIDG